MARDLLTPYLRFDARSLGLFRIGIGLTLLFDLFHRWDWLDAFYSNEGVLPNHNHLFQFKDGGEVWSVYHSFSSADENLVAFLVTLFFYACFTVGWKTRAFHAVSLVCLIGLSARNTLAESSGNSVAIALLLVTLFLPLGRRFSIDSLRASFAAFDEKTAEDLNDRSLPVAGVATPSLAAPATLLLLGLILMGGAAQQTGATWQDGSALYYALHVDRWTSAIGVALREKTGLLSGWTHAFRYAALLVVPLALLPVGRKVTGVLATLLLLFVGLTLGVLFTLGLHGWSLAAAAFLLVPKEAWDALAKRRPTTLIYDDDCGICLFCARLVKRLDLRGNITFVANSDESQLPEGVTLELANESMIAVDAAGKHYLDIDAVAEVVRALPLLGWLGFLMRLPEHLRLPMPKDVRLLHRFGRWLYLKVARNRLDISVAVGMGACGVPSATADIGDEEEVASPAARTASALSALVASSGALLVLACVWAQTERNNTLPVSLGLGDRQALVSLATYARILAPWGLWAPDPPLANEALVVVAKTRGDYVVDVLTGYPPDEALADPKRARHGALWAAYTASIARDTGEPYRNEFRRYLTKGGYALDTKVPNNYIRDLSVYWVTRPTPAPGAKGEPAPATKIEIFNRRGPAGGPDRPSLPRVKPEDE